MRGEAILICQFVCQASLTIDGGEEESPDT